MGFEELHARSQAVVQGLPDAPTKLAALAVDYVAFARERPAVFRVMFGGHVPDKACYPELQQTASGAMDTLNEVLVQGQREGTLDVTDPAIDALVCWASVHGCACLLVDRALPEHKLTDAGVSLEQVIGAVVEGIRRGLDPNR